MYILQDAGAEPMLLKYFACKGHVGELRFTVLRNMLNQRVACKHQAGGLMVLSIFRLHAPLVLTCAPGGEGGKIRCSLSQTMMSVHQQNCLPPCLLVCRTDEFYLRGARAGGLLTHMRLVYLTISVDFCHTALCCLKRELVLFLHVLVAAAAVKY